MQKINISCNVPHEGITTATKNTTYPHCKVFGENLKTHRLRINKSQLSVEMDAGIAFGSLSRIETGQTIPKLYTFLSIVKALDLSEEEIIQLLHQLYE